MALAVCAASVVLNLVDLYANGLGHGLHFLDANWEFSWSHDLDTALLAAGMLAAIVGSRRASARPRIWRWTAVILGLFFLDEATPAHTAIDRLWHGKLLYVPILVGLELCVWILAADSEQRAIVFVGLATLCLSFAMHVLGVPALRPLGYYTGIYQTAVGIKEGLECAGLILVVPSLWKLASSVRRREPATAAA